MQMSWLTRCSLYMFGKHILSIDYFYKLNAKYNMQENIKL